MNIWDGNSWFTHFPPYQKSIMGYWLLIHLQYTGGTREAKISSRAGWANPKISQLVEHLYMLSSVRRIRMDEEKLFFGVGVILKVPNGFI